MGNVVYGHFDSAGSLHKQISELARDSYGFYDDNRLIRLYAGAIAECLLEYDDWKEGLDDYFTFSKDLSESLCSATWMQQGYAISSLILDKDLELGRSVIRSYLDDTPETSFLMLRQIRSSLRSLIEYDTQFWQQLYDMAAAALVTEQMVHVLCDQAIDICIGGAGWTLGDCVQAMATLSGQYHARVIEVKDIGTSEPAVIDHDFDYMISTMMNEAMRLGMPDDAGMYTMLAANDCQHYIPYHKAESIDVIAAPLYTVFHIKDSDLKSMMMAKATGRMMAVAAAGDNPDMDSCVVTPLALSSMQGSFISSLNR
jgi:hypothetical protein